MRWFHVIYDIYLEGQLISIQNNLIRNAENLLWINGREEFYSHCCKFNDSKG